MTDEMDFLNTVDWHKWRIKVLLGKRDTPYYRRQISQHRKSIKRIEAEQSR